MISLDTPERVAFVSDVHGQNELLKRAVDISFSKYKSDKLIFAGDAIHRGVDSLGVLRTIGTLGSKVIYLAGNHEAVFAGAHQELQVGQDFQGKAWDEMYRRMSGNKDILEKVGMEERVQIESVIRSLPLYYEDELRFAVHAGLVEGSISKTKSELQLSMVDTLLNRRYSGIAQSLSDSELAQSEEGAIDADKLVVTGHIHHPLSYYQSLGTREIAISKRLHIGAVEGFLPLLIDDSEQRDFVIVSHASS